MNESLLPRENEKKLWKNWGQRVAVFLTSKNRRCKIWTPVIKVNQMFGMMICDTNVTDFIRTAEK